MSQSFVSQTSSKGTTKHIVLIVLETSLLGSFVVLDGSYSHTYHHYTGHNHHYLDKNLLEQWRDSYQNNDDYDLYDNDMYENHDLSEHLQSICDDLDITVRGSTRLTFDNQANLQTIVMDMPSGLWFPKLELEDPRYFMNQNQHPSRILSK
ncbi:hypothetical protein Tco_0121162 [Tanacetum coccineum]